METLVLTWRRDDADPMTVIFTAYGTEAIVRVAPGDGSPLAPVGSHTYAAPGVYLATGRAIIGEAVVERSVEVLVELAPAPPAKAKRSRKAEEEVVDQP